jgi:hypothetical protein
MRQVAERILAMFSSKYLCEQLFSLMEANKSAPKSRLVAERISSILKMASSQNQKPDTEKLVSRENMSNI